GTEYVDQSGKSIFPFQVTGTPATFDENGVAVVEILHRGASHQEVEARRRRLAAKAARRVRARDGTQQLGGTGQAPNGQELVLHRERGVLWPPGWNEVGGGEPVLCWPELEKQKRAGEGGAQ
ncbi:MAG: hypothetical protein RBU37_24220, partial [Myxococcota bacterium]|nr:hypothetical protein [Myxococcota bacterium]